MLLLALSRLGENDPWECLKKFEELFPEAVSLWLNPKEESILNGVPDDQAEVGWIDSISEKSIKLNPLFSKNVFRRMMSFL